MPLAIELAAARITVMTPAELLAGLDDRFQLLSGGRRRQRQRTLEATLDWSYNLLEPKHQDVFRALGVFVGGFDVDAVAAVADIPRAAALDTIEALVAKSLVVRLDAPSAATRFALLETLKAYAEDRLIQTDEAARIRDRHADYYHQLTMTLGRTLLPDARLGARLRVDRANISSAIEWSLLNNQLVRAGELLLGSYEAYDTDGHVAEAVGLYERCVGPLSDLDRELADFLSIGRMQSCITLEDWDAFFVVGAQLAASPDPRARCVANAVDGHPDRRSTFTMRRWSCTRRRPPTWRSRGRVLRGVPQKPRRRPCSSRARCSWRIRVTTDRRCSCSSRGHPISMPRTT